MDDSSYYYLTELLRLRVRLSKGLSVNHLRMNDSVSEPRNTVFVTVSSSHLGEKMYHGDIIWSQ